MSSSSTSTLCRDFQQNSDYIGRAYCGRVSVVECDILIIGAGASGLTAAASIRDQRLRVLLVEKDEYVGGTTFRSGGCMWMPFNPRMQEQGIEDNREQAKRYIHAVRNAKGEGQDLDSMQERLWNRWLEVYLTQGPRMMDYLQGEGFRWMATPSAIPDYHAQYGAVEYGRTLDPEVFDAVTLGDWLRYLPPQDDAPVIRRFEDIFALTRPPYSVDGAASLAPPHTAVRPLSMGRSLVAQLLKICKNHNNVNIWTQCELQELQCSETDHRVTGARIQCGRRGSLIDIRALQGVVLSTGGFSQNQEMRDTYLKVRLTKGTNPQFSSKAEWSLAAPSDMGIALQVGQKLGADTEQLDQVWGIPTMIDPATGKSREAMFAITKPFSIVTDAKGFRFFSESQPYGVAVKSMYKRAREVPEGGAFWLIFDNIYMQRYSIGGLVGQASVSQAVSNGFLFCSETIGGLANQILHHNHNLEATVDEWNKMCKAGKDRHFQRGQERYQKFTGDPEVMPNPCMGPVKVNPFYAIEILPGDAGTRGGPVTDELSRVLDRRGNPIQGWFAGGNASISRLDTEGAGTTIGPAMTEGFVAATHIQSAANNTKPHE